MNGVIISNNTVWTAIEQLNNNLATKAFTWKANEYQASAGSKTLTLDQSEAFYILLTAAYGANREETGTLYYVVKNSGVAVTPFIYPIKTGSKVSVSAGSGSITITTTDSYVGIYLLRLI